MASAEFNLLGAIEVHSVDEIRKILDEGFDVQSLIKGKSVVAHLTEMYSRSDHFPDCLRLLLERGPQLDDPRIGPVLLNDSDGLSTALRDDPSLIGHRTSMVSAFTPLISYAQFGLLPQVHRKEHDIYEDIRVLLDAASRKILVVTRRQGAWKVGWGQKYAPRR